ncbi:4-hydroxythreonine-4-phosphate dehydrogenase PdxA [Flavobacterium oreochromis]|uniref:4-hydroxythreonine-4-phosphate dehydrogenase PdxA n=1 Tax=Flavobacterium oreochromis TaxID=2906078 RepID=UPI000CDB10F1|nr:4-hydroxythreonine-4-phosphate dehydrogenase PdxA [Flavobacterium columnare]
MTKKPENIIIGISIGDLNGIGSEVVLKSFEDTRMLELCTPIIFANVKIISYLKKQLNLNVNLHGIDKIDQAVVGKVNVLNVWKEGVNLEWGIEDQNVGKYAIKSFIAATQALKENKVDVLVTAPISKVNIQSDEFSFPGHTDYLNQELEGDALMLMIQDTLRVGLLTDHIPINEVASYLTEDLVMRKIKTINRSLIEDFQINRPKIAVLGLNPHSGDHGVIGQEEEIILKPALKKLFEEGIMVFGPYSADGFFGSAQYEKYDAVVATYHDQGLIPFKTLSFGRGVNYTAGLNKIRTSPDHGTGFDIAGKGLANHASFTEAIYAALDIFKARNIYKEIAANPLKTK